MKIDLTNEQKLELENIALKHKLLQEQMNQLNNLFQLKLKEIAEKHNYTLEDIIGYNLDENHIEIKEKENVHDKN